MTAEVDHKSKQRNQLNASRSRYVSGLRGCRYSDSGRRGRGGYCGIGRDNPRQYGPTLSLSLSLHVDGKTVEWRHYPSDDFQKLTQAQRTKVIELRKKRHISHTVNSYDNKISALRDDFTSIGDAIIDGVS